MISRNNKNKDNIRDMWKKTNDESKKREREREKYRVLEL
jgi:hypothetical protein